MKLYKEKNRWHLKIGKIHIHGPKLLDVLKSIRMTFIMIVIFFSCNAQPSGNTPIDVLSEPQILVPVKLIFFNAVPTKDGIRFRWATASEVDNDRFEIYGSFTAHDDDWVRILVTSGSGTTKYEKYYDFTITEIENKYVYYRLKQIDFDGHDEQLKVIYVGPENYILSKPIYFSINGQLINEDTPGFKIEYSLNGIRKIYLSR